MQPVREFLQQKIEELSFTKVVYDEAVISTKVLDSISVVDLLVAIEEHTGIFISNSEYEEEKFDTINRMVEFLNSKGYSGE
ncbi:MAG: acyl carrier protein [Flavobacteriales bacterium]